MGTKLFFHHAQDWYNEMASVISLVKFLQIPATHRVALNVKVTAR